MRKYVKNLVQLLLVGGLCALVAACSGGGGGGGGTGTGTLSTSLTDSSTEDYLGVYVTIERVEVSSDAGGSWQTVATPNATYNLLELVNGVREELGLVDLAAGHYNQLRMILGDTPDSSLNLLGLSHDHANYLIDTSNTVHELKVPSGLQSGIKVVQGFDISASQTTELILDFDAMESVVKAGNSGQYLLKPTIKVRETSEAALLSGSVSDNVTDLGIEGVLVSAQQYDGTALDDKDLVAVESSTITTEDDGLTVEDETGQYALFLPAGAYNLVAYYSGYEPQCHEVTLAAGETANEDFILGAAVGIGTVQGSVSISDGVADQHVTIDFRRSGLCSGDLNKQISVKTVEVTNGVDYSVDLPAGTYQVVSSTPDHATQATTIIVSDALVSNHSPAF